MTDDNTTDDGEHSIQIDDSTEVFEENLDRLCWFIVSTRNHFFPPDEQARKAVEAFDKPEDRIEHEYGYFCGGFTMLDEVVDFLENSGVDVEGRAERYVEEDEFDLTLDPHPHEYDKDSLEDPTEDYE